MKLLGKVALVTGGSQGIGRGVALRLARDGADVVVAYRSHPEEAKETSAEIEAYGRRVVAFKADFEQPNGDTVWFQRHSAISEALTSLSTTPASRKRLPSGG